MKHKRRLKKINFCQLYSFGQNLTRLLIKHFKFESISKSANEFFFFTLNLQVNQNRRSNSQLWLIRNFSLLIELLELISTSSEQEKKFNSHLLSLSCQLFHPEKMFSSPFFLLLFLVITSHSGWYFCAIYKCHYSAGNCFQFHSVFLSSGQFARLSRSSCLTRVMSREGKESSNLFLWMFLSNNMRKGVKKKIEQK